MTEEPPTEFAERWRVARACARCRRLKSKCVYESPAHQTCKRCFSLKLKCSVEADPTAPAAKRRQMRLPQRTPDQIMSKVARLLADAEKEFSRMPDMEVARLDWTASADPTDFCDPADPAEHSVGSADTSSRLKEISQAALRLYQQSERLYRAFSDTAAIESAETGPESRNRTLPWPQKAAETISPKNFRPASAQSNDSSQIPAISVLASTNSASAPSETATAATFLYNLMSEAEARARYEYFHKNMACSFPVLSFPSFLQIFPSALESCPLLVLACIYVTTLRDRGLSERGNDRAVGAQIIAFLDQSLAQTVFVEASNLSYHLVFACMVLSLWDVPPSRVHQYKSQIDLITAYSVAICIDAGKVSGTAPLTDESAERNNLRSFLAVFCSGGSLNISLPRFNFVAWTSRHDFAAKLLLRPLHGLPTNRDKFLCYYARVIREGKQLADFLTDNGVSMNLLTSAEERGGFQGLDPANPHKHSLQFKKLVNDLMVFKAKLTDVISESGVLTDGMSDKVDPGEKSCLLLTYYYLIMMIHDNLVSWCIYKLTADSSLQAQERFFPEIDKSLILEHVIKFGEACERILDCFIGFTANGVSDFPTFFYYRAVSTLIALIRVSILVKSDISQQYFPEIHCVRFRLPALYAEVSQLVEDSKQKFDSQVCERLTEVLGRIGHWVKVVDERHQPTSHNGDVDFLKLTGLSQGQEVEKLMAPQTANMRANVNSPAKQNSIGIAADTPDGNGHDFSGSASAPIQTANFSIQKMFKGIDEDIIAFLNPFDTLDTSFSFNFS
ncbi:hypothetical protein OXX69_000833 [Metschnikowia pulcherrima]